MFENFTYSGLKTEEKKHDTGNKTNISKRRDFSSDF